MLQLKEAARCSNTQRLLSKKQLKAAERVLKLLDSSSTFKYKLVLKEREAKLETFSGLVATIAESKNIEDSTAINNIATMLAHNIIVRVYYINAQHYNAEVDVYKMLNSTDSNVLHLVKEASKLTVNCEASDNYYVELDFYNMLK